MIAKYRGHWSAEEIAAGLVRPYEVDAGLPFHFPFEILGDPGDGPEDLPFTSTTYLLKIPSSGLEAAARAFFTAAMRVVVLVDDGKDLVKVVRGPGEPRKGGRVTVLEGRDGGTWCTGPLLFRAPKRHSITVRGVSIRRDDGAELTSWDYEDGFDVPAGREFEMEPHFIQLAACGNPGVKPRLLGHLGADVIDFS